MQEAGDRKRGKKGGVYGDTQKDEIMPSDDHPKKG